MRSPANTPQRFILLPVRGLRGDSNVTSVSSRNFLSALDARVGIAAASVESAATPNIPAGVTTIDSIGETGAKLVELTVAAAEAIKKNEPGLRIVPVQYYTPALAPRPTISQPATIFAHGASQAVQLIVVDKLSGAPIPNAHVVAFTNFATRAGAEGDTNAQGKVALRLSSSSILIDRLYIYPKTGAWPFLKRNFTLTSGVVVKLTPIALDFVDGLRFFYGAKTVNSDGAGVTVGVVDTGIAPHPDLTIAGGFNAVSGENPIDFGDNGEGHGTHVAGIIAAHGVPPTGIRGVAPAVTLRSYRVFGKGQPGADNFAIAKAIDQAVADGCDLLNLSLGGGPPDPTLETAIKDARAAGVVIICASGNNDRNPVSFPGAEPLALAVSALGRVGTYPAGAEEEGNVQKPPSGKDAKNYITSFSNVGPELDLTAPGDGIISTFPGGYAVLDGTSMACPAATGRAARLLAANPAILNQNRDVNRSDAIAKLLLTSATSLGFGPTFEGQGLLP